MKRKLAIVSSYDVECGNASYTSYLSKEFRKHFDVDILPLNHNSSGYPPSLGTKVRENYFRQIGNKLLSYDYVNLQLELGLFGNTPSEIENNVIGLIDKAPNLILTIHHFEPPTLVKANNVKILKSILKGHLRTAVTELLNPTGANPLFDCALKRIIERVKYHANTKQVSIVVHSEKQKEEIEVNYGFNRILAYPLTFLSEEQKLYFQTNKEAVRQTFLKRYNLNPDNIYVNMFGFLSENKNHHCAVKAIDLLPPEYRLLIFGGQSVYTINKYVLDWSKGSIPNNSNYISSLIDLAEKVNRSHGCEKVRFCGVTPDDLYLESMVASDYIVMPYLETGQNGSGNAALTLEVGAKLITSRMEAFRKLSKYYPNCFQMTDISNHLELASSILNFQVQSFSSNTFNIETSITLQKEIFEGTYKFG